MYRYTIHYTIHYTLYTIHYTTLYIYTIHYTLYTIHYTTLYIYTIHYTLHYIHYTCELMVPPSLVHTVLIALAVLAIKFHSSDFRALGRSSIIS